MDHPTQQCAPSARPGQRHGLRGRGVPEAEATPYQHCETLKGWGGWLPWAWPHDGLQHDKQSGKQLAASYCEHGLAMMSDKATFSDGSYGFEAGVNAMLERVQTGRFKVFGHLEQWFEEFRTYHRKPTGW